MCAKHGLHANDDSRSYFSNWELVAHTLQDSGNKVSRRSAITGTANITLGGRTVIMAEVQLRGDLHPTRAAPSQSGKESTPTSISIGRCTVISTGSIIKPPSRISRGQVHYYPMKIGDNVFVGMWTHL
jgi:dynactin-5